MKRPAPLLMVVLLAGPADALHAQVLTAAPAVLVTEHADINISFAGGQWDVQLRDDDNFVSYASGEAVVHVDRLARTTRPASSSFDFIGVGPGEPFYRITSFQTPGLIYLGNAAYGVPLTAVDLYNANAESGGRVNGNGRWVRLLLHSVDGPGHYSVWSNTLGGPVRFHSTAQSGPAPADTNTLWLVAGGHAHFNYGFTRPGLYRVNYIPAAYLNDNNPATLGPESRADTPISVYFNVDPGYAVSGLTPASALPRVATMQFLGGYRDVPVGGATRGAVHIGEVFSATTYVLLDLVNPDDANAVRLALRGFPEGPLYDLPAVPPTAVLDDTPLALYGDFDLALRFDSLPGSRFDFEFDYSMILGGVHVARVGVLGLTIPVPEPAASAAVLLPALALLGRRAHRSSVDLTSRRSQSPVAGRAPRSRRPDVPRTTGEMP
ncbi:MAG: choice-of-anchor M domain-containing protein [Tepidisphaerales bacterium]